MDTEYTQLPDGRWQLTMLPQPVTAYYIRDDHTALPLPLDVDAAMTAI